MWLGLDDQRMSKAMRKATVVLAALLLPMALQGATAAAPTNAYDLIANTPSLSILKAAVDKTGLAVTLKNGSLAATLFLPSNTAFRAFVTEVQTKVRSQGGKNKAFSYTNTSLLADPMLRTLLLFHVVPRAFRTAELKNIYKLTTLAGSTLIFNTQGATVSVADAFKRSFPLLASGDKIVGKSVYHVLDGVLAPPSFTLIAGRPNPPAPPALAKTPPPPTPRKALPPPRKAASPPPKPSSSLQTPGSTLYDAFASEGFTEFLYMVNAVSDGSKRDSSLTDWRTVLKTSSWTVFVPTNLAISSVRSDIGSEVADLLFSPAGLKLMQDLLAATIVPGKPALSLTNGQKLTPVGGQTITVAFIKGQATVTNAFLEKGEEMPVMLPGLIGSNGVAYLIDEGLLPPASVDDLAVQYLKLFGGLGGTR